VLSDTPDEAGFRLQRRKTFREGGPPGLEPVEAWIDDGVMGATGKILPNDADTAANVQDISG
jgi:hypothetical protein